MVECTENEREGVGEQIAEHEAGLPIEPKEEPQYKDRTTMLRVVGGGLGLVGFLLVVGAVFLGALAFGMYLGAEIPGYSPDSMTWLCFFVALFGLLYFVFGVGTMGCKPWARKGMRIVTLLSMVTFFLAGAGIVLWCAASEIPEINDPGGPAFFMFLFLGLVLLFLIIPNLLLFLFYGRKNILATVQNRAAEPRWAD